MVKEEKDVVEIDLWKLLSVYLKKWWLILLCGFLVAGVAFFATKSFITPLYRAHVTIYVNNAKSNQAVDYITGSNLQAAQQLVNTYVNIIKSDTVLEEVIQKGGLKDSYTPETLRKIMSASQIEDTEMFKVSVTCPDSKMAAHIANTIADVAPDMISDFVEGSSTKIIDRAKVPQHRDSPSYTKNTVLGGLLGVILAGIVVTLQYLFDSRISNEEDLKQLFDLPVLGRIPAFEQTASKKPEEHGAKNTVQKS